jgi:hypothetical protein
VDSNFTPIPALARNDADVNLLFLLNNIVYSRQLNDAVFPAPNAVNVSAPMTSTLFTSNVSVSALGCIEQYQLCGSNLCTIPGGYFQLMLPDTLQQLSLSPAQNATAYLISQSLYLSQMYWEYFILSSDMLLARNKVPSADGRLAVWENASMASAAGWYFYSSPLPDNQWQLEAEQIHNVGLAMLQTIGDYAAPQDYTIRPGVQANQFITPPDTKEAKALCLQQKVRSTEYSSFSVFGLAFVLAVGSLIIALSIAIPYLVGRIQSRSSSTRARNRREEWIRDDVLQLLRAVLERDGDEWIGKEEKVPVTVEYAKKMVWQLLDDVRTDHSADILIRKDVVELREASRSSLEN